MPEVQITGGVMLVDDEDLWMTDRWSWCVGNHGYAHRGYLLNGRNKIELFHRAIAKPPPGMQVDHINHNRLDNRRANLRVVTRGENQRNRKGANKNSKTGVRGVRVLPSGRFNAETSVYGHRTYVGTFDTLELATAAVVESRKTAEA